MTEVMEDRNVRGLNFKLLPRKLYGKADNEEGRQKNVFVVKTIHDVRNMLFAISLLLFANYSSMMVNHTASKNDFGLHSI